MLKFLGGISSPRFIRLSGKKSPRFILMSHDVAAVWYSGSICHFDKNVSIHTYIAKSKVKRDAYILLHMEY